MNSFKETLRNLRDKKELSQNQLAKKLSVAQNTISNWELGTRKPDLEMMNVIANFFEVSVDYLLGRTETKNLTSPDGETDEVNEILEALHKRPEMKTLFSMSQKATKEDLEKAMRIIEALKNE